MGAQHTCVITNSDQIKCWGDNRKGQLGGESNSGAKVKIGDENTETGLNLEDIKLGADRSAKQIAAGAAHTCAILDNDSVKCWGNNQFGQLGQGDDASRGTITGQMGDTLAPINLGTGRTAKQIALGANHSCAILDNGRVKCWGQNLHGQLGIGDTAGSKTLIGDETEEMGDDLEYTKLGKIAVGLALGENHSCALLQDHSVQCWGDNQYGQLGLGDIKTRGEAAGEMGADLPRIDLGAEIRAQAITAGSNHTCAILQDDRMKCWGHNDAGQLGLGDTNDRGGSTGQMGQDLPILSLFHEAVQWWSKP